MAAVSDLDRVVGKTVRGVGYGSDEAELRRGNFIVYFTDGSALIVYAGEDRYDDQVVHSEFWPAKVPVEETPLDQERAKVEALLRRLADRDAAVERLSDELAAVMHSVDKWFLGDVPETNPATRAAEAREIALMAIDRLKVALASVESRKDGGRS